MFDIFDFFDEMEFFRTGSVQKEEKRCNTCGKTYNDFVKSGKIGCSECYSTFSDNLKTVLKQIHPDYKHCGKIPGNLRAEFSQKRKLEDTKRQLKIAVQNEDYEQAAKLHKEILELERGN